MKYKGYQILGYDLAGEIIAAVQTASTNSAYTIGAQIFTQDNVAKVKIFYEDMTSPMATYQK